MDEMVRKWIFSPQKKFTDLAIFTDYWNFWLNFTDY